MLENCYLKLPFFHTLLKYDQNLIETITPTSLVLKELVPPKDEWHFASQNNFESPSANGELLFIFSFRTG